MTLKPGWPERAVAEAATNPAKRPFRFGTLEQQTRRQSPRRGRTLKSIGQKLDRVLGKVEGDDD